MGRKKNYFKVGDYIIIKNPLTYLKKDTEYVRNRIVRIIDISNNLYKYHIKYCEKEVNKKYMNHVEFFVFSDKEVRKATKPEIMLEVL